MTRFAWTIPGANTAVVPSGSYIRRDNLTDRIADYPEPVPAGLIRNMYAYAQSPTNGTGLTALDPKNLTTSVRGSVKAGDDWQFWGDWPIGQSLWIHNYGQHGTITNNVRFITKAGETRCKLRGGGTMHVPWGNVADTWQWLEDFELEGDKATGGGSTPVLLDQASNCFIISCEIHHGGGSGVRALGGNNLHIRGNDIYYIGSLPGGNGGDCITLSSTNTVDQSDSEMILNYLKLAGHTCTTLQSFVNPPICDNNTVAWTVMDNPHAGSLGSHHQYQNTLIQHLVVQNIGTDMVSTGIGSRVGVILIGDYASYRHVRMRNIRREGVKFQSGSWSGGFYSRFQHAYHVTGDKVGREGVFCLDSDAVGAGDLRNNLYQNSFFTNCNVDETTAGGGSGNGASGKWSPLTYNAYSAQLSHWVDPVVWDSGAALARCYVEYNVFGGMTRDTVSSSWTLNSGSVYYADMPNKFKGPEDPESPNLVRGLTLRSSYSGEALWEDGQLLTRRTSLAGIVGAGEYWNDQATGRIYVWALTGVPSAHTYEYGRDPTKVIFMARNPHSSSGGWANHALANAESTFVELSNNVHDPAFTWANPDDTVAMDQSLLGYDRANPVDLDEFLRLTTSSHKNLGTTTLGKTITGITEFNISTLSGTGEPSSGYGGTDPDIGAWEEA